MPERSKGQRWRPGQITLPAILIICGILFLLSNYNLIPGGWWESAWRLWPLVLIFIGIDLILRHVGGWVATALMVLLVIVAIVAVVLLIAAPSSSPGDTAISERGEAGGARLSASFDHAETGLYLAVGAGCSGVTVRRAS